ncbi:hypothetical protein GCM10008090_12740 [Arenicella chitinivorans]|uniref:Lipoprotein n=1 Tax=Arenicella chitinivorans TaxID=1329800 RepID=A0A918VJS9_9GAMM|nr:hypothetical protein [Arenicella chitinivorans]GHA04750.1 hypothetical protein GCM10008090_12740 [Arenicella chitinivorans]
MRFMSVVFGLFLAGCAAKHDSAILVFTGSAPADYQSLPQSVQLLACNNTQINTEMAWNQRTLKSVPYGWQTDGKDEFFISKYYVASPPVPKTFKPGKPITLGVLSQDHFSLYEDDEVVPIFFDYTLLDPIKLADIKVDYGNRLDGVAACADYGINTIPINIRCPSFKYRGSDQYGLGKGIAQLSREQENRVLTDHGHLFIPLRIEPESNPHIDPPLEGCTAEILNDIILEHQVYFGTAANHVSKIDLTKAYRQFVSHQTPITLYCRPRPQDQLAAGCAPLLPLDPEKSE